MRASAYCAHPNMRDHWALRCMNRCRDQVGGLCKCSKGAGEKTTENIQVKFGIYNASEHAQIKCAKKENRHFHPMDDAVPYFNAHRWHIQLPKPIGRAKHNAIGLHRNEGASRFNGPYGRQDCVLARTVESNQGGRFDGNESVADSFRSGAKYQPVWKENSLPGVNLPSTPLRLR
ncbi:hypothetical protein TNCV_1196541 [Trichonephila clavipes]|uniref:Uncharacterized protein n=1 Tax=Trichonephila clavipes TaxID=2585209 RepID=A0A8X6V926_TRICX|nr:hypothetical protein TNCV_1196541 [Trichonephila clavipes]